MNYPGLESGVEESEKKSWASAQNLNSIFY